MLERQGLHMRQDMVDGVHAGLGGSPRLQAHADAQAVPDVGPVDSAG